MYEHISKVENAVGMPITRVKSEQSFEYLLLECPIERKENSLSVKQGGNSSNGYSWAGPKMRWCTSRLKDVPREKYLKPLREKYNIIEYVGIAADEQFRLERKRNKSANHVHPLIEWGMTEADCLNYCYEKGYDCQSRKIDGNLVSELAHSGLLYQDKKGNAVFLHKDDDGKTVGAELQGTSTYQRFKGVAAGTADSVFSLKFGTPNKVYVFESAIDLLSFRQLASPSKLQDSVLVSMAGLKPSALKSLAERGLPLYACVDNDEAGARFISENNLIPCNRVLADSGVKDFNELLQKTLHTRELIDKSQSAQSLPTEPSKVKSPPPSHKVRR